MNMPRVSGINPVANCIEIEDPVRSVEAVLFVFAGNSTLPPRGAGWMVVAMKLELLLNPDMWPSSEQLKMDFRYYCHGIAESPVSVVPLLSSAN